MENLICEGFVLLSKIGTRTKLEGGPRQNEMLPGFKRAVLQRKKERKKNCVSVEERLEY